MLRNLNEWNLVKFLGIRNYERANRIGDNYLYEAQNSRFEAGVWACRPGYSKYGNELTGGTEDKGMFDYLYNDSGVLEHRFVRYYNKKFYKYSAGTWVELTGGRATDSRVRGVNFENNLYIVSPEDGMGKLVGDTFTEVDSAKKATAAVIFEGRLFLLGNPTAPYTIIASAPIYVDATKIEEFNVADGGLISSLPEGGRLMTAKSFRDTLYVFAEDKIFFTQGTSTLSSGSVVLPWDTYASDYGAVSPDAVCEVRNDLWVITKNKQIRTLGVRANYGDQVRTEDLTYILRRTLKSVDFDPDSLSMFFDGDNVRISLKTKGSPTPNIVVIYNYETRAWGVDVAFAATSFIKIENQIFFSKPNSGQIYIADEGYLDDTFSYSFKGRTSLQDLGRPDIYKEVRYIYIRGAKTPGLPVTVNLFRDDYQTSSSYTIAAGGSSSSSVTTHPIGADPVGEVPVGGGTATDSEYPAMEEFNVVIPVKQVGRLFGVELSALISSQRLEIYQMIISYRPKTNKHSFK